MNKIIVSLMMVLMTGYVYSKPKFNVNNKGILFYKGKPYINVNFNSILNFN